MDSAQPEPKQWSRWKNFDVWHGRLPHWRADDVSYYVTFRHRRDLSQDECETVLRELLKTNARKLDLLIACVLPRATEVMFTVRSGIDGRPYELSDAIEKAKAKAGKLIQKATGERWPPFYAESYDRIVRDMVEFEERWLAIVDSPVAAELAEDPDDYPSLWVMDHE